MYAVVTTMSSSTPSIPAKQRRKNSSKPHDMVSFGSTKTDGKRIVNQGMRKRETTRYRRDISVGHQPQTIGMVQNFDVRVQDNANRTENPFDENPYMTIEDIDSNNSDSNYLHPVSSGTDDSRINERMGRIKRWKIDKVEKRKRLSATSSASQSKKSFSDEDSDDVFNTEKDNLQSPSRKHGASSKYGPVSIYQLILLVLAVASLTCVIVFGVLFLFKPQDSSVLMELEKVQDRLTRQETQIKNLSARLEERDSIITHLVKESAQLKADFDDIIQSFTTQKNFPKGRPDS